MTTYTRAFFYSNPFNDCGIAICDQHTVACRTCHSKFCARLRNVPSGGTFQASAINTPAQRAQERITPIGPRRAAQREFLKAIELSPNYANAHLYYAGGYLTPMGRHADAIAEMKKALELDRLSSALNNMGETFLLAGDISEVSSAIPAHDRPGSDLPTCAFFRVLSGRDRKYEQAIEEMQKGALLECGTHPRSCDR